MDKYKRYWKYFKKEFRRIHGIGRATYNEISQFIRNIENGTYDDEEEMQSEEKEPEHTINGTYKEIGFQFWTWYEKGRDEQLLSTIVYLQKQALYFLTNEAGAADHTAQYTGKKIKEIADYLMEELKIDKMKKDKK